MSEQVFRLPDLGEGLTEAEIIEWQVAEGDQVEIDQHVVVVETAKATVEVPCPFAGQVLTLHGRSGDQLEVGQPLITIAPAGAPRDGAPSDGAPAGDASLGRSGGSRDGDTTKNRHEDEVLAGAEQYRSEERAGTAGPTGATATGRSTDGAGSEGSDSEGSGAVLIGYGTGAPRARRRRARRTPTPTGPPPPADHGPESLRPDARWGHQLRTSIAGEAGDGVAQAAASPEASSPGAVKVISPIVRRLAASEGLDLATVPPSGPGGVIRRQDVEDAIAARQPAAAGPSLQPDTASASALGVPGAESPRNACPDDLRIPLRGVRRAMADKLTQSRREIPDATTWVDVDATGLMRAKDEIRAVHPEAGVGVLALMARICVAGLRRFPELNASVDTEAQEIVQHAAIHLGFAAQSPRGLVVPVVHDAHRMTTVELATALRELTDRAREGRLSPAELTGGTFTLNNYGVFGVDGSTPIINHPEAAMLGVGRIIDKPWAHRGELALRKVTQLSFTFDHRVCDGGTAGGFLRYVADCAESPAAMLATL